MSKKELCRALSFVIALLTCCQPFGSEALADTSEGSSNSKEIIGWVVPNTTHPDIGVPYLLTDKAGSVYFYLRPSAGMQLSRYANKRVRIRGAETPMENSRTPMLEIEQLGPPDVALRRKAAPNRITPSPSNRNTQQASAEQVVPASYSENLVTAKQPVEDSPGPIRNSFGEVGLTSTPTPIPQVPVPEAENTNFLDQASEDCGGCGGASCPTCSPPCGLPGKFWVRTEYLYWYTSGMHLPPLVTTGPSPDQPGYIGSPGTVVLFGDSRVNGFGRSGGRVTAGMWLDNCNQVGIQGDYFALASVATNFSATSGGNPILSRPFFDTRPDLNSPNVEQVASPGSIAGTVAVNVPTQFQSAGVNMLFNLCCCNNCYCDACLPGMNGPGGYRLDFMLGYRFYRLGDGVNVTETLASLDPTLPGSFIVNDSFTTQNQFHGVEFGTSMQAFRGLWGFECLSRIAMGNNTEMVTINGSTATTQNGVTTNDVGGLLAQRSNIGHYRRDEFAVVPQIGLNLLYQLTPGLRATVGYTFVYWSRVARAGDQIDTDVNSTLLPNNPNPPAGDLRHPQFVFRDTDFWAQGISAGLEYRW